MTVTGGNPWPPRQGPGEPPVRRPVARSGGRHRSEPDDGEPDPDPGPWPRQGYGAGPGRGPAGAPAAGWALPAGGEPGPRRGSGRHRGAEPVGPPAGPGVSGWSEVPSEDGWAGAPRQWPPGEGHGRGAYPSGYPPPAGAGGAGGTGGYGGYGRGPGVDGEVGHRLDTYRGPGRDRWPAGQPAPVHEVLTPDAVVDPEPLRRAPDRRWAAGDDGPGVVDGEAGTGARRAHPPRSVVRRRARRRRLLEWPVLAAASLAAAVLIRMLVLETFFIPSPSMHPTLVEHDRVLVNKLSYHLHDVHRGDVVVFRRPPNLHVNDKDLIKRVIGLPGDTVEARDRKVYVNGRLLREPYVPAGCRGTEDFLRVAVPSDHVFVMGDNRCDSTDSRVFGPISVDLLVGRAFVRMWPPSRFGWL